MMKKIFPLLIVFILLFSSVAADDLEMERQKGQELAEESFGPVLNLLFKNQVIQFKTSDDMLQFFASALLVYFFLTQLMGMGGIPLVFLTMLVLVLLQHFLVMNWVVFLVDMAPAILVYLVIFDLTTFSFAVSRRNAQLMGLFGFAITFWFHPTRQIFENTFGELYTWTTGFLFFIFLVLIGFARFFSVMVKATSTVAAQEASTAAKQNMERFYRAVVQELQAKREGP